MLFLCYPKCSTCQKAKAFLEANGVSYVLRDIKTENPTEEELRQWHKLSGLPLKFTAVHETLYPELKNQIGNLLPLSLQRKIK